jgi:multimeric flavodoxin WrbA
MNILFITGSARSDSITAKLCDIAASAMSDSNITFMKLHGMRIEHCNGCDSCSPSGICVIRDDMHNIYEAVVKNDVIVIATPIYFSGPSSMMKQMIDRFHCVWIADKGKKKGKKAALITAAGSPSPVLSGTVSIAKAFAMTVGAEWIGELAVNGTDGMTDIPENIFKEAYSFGSRIVLAYSEKV